MAFIILTNGKTKSVSAEKGAAIWRVLNNEVEPSSEAQEEFCLKVKRIYLNRENAPESYSQAFPLPESEVGKQNWKEPWYQR